jgi:hypothetical protein
VGSKEHTRSRLLWLEQVADDHGLPATALHVAFRLSGHANSATGEAFPSQETLSREVGITDRALRGSLSALVGRGHLIEAGHRARCVVYKMSLRNRNNASDFGTVETGTQVPTSETRKPERSFQVRPDVTGSSVQRSRKLDAPKSEDLCREPGSQLPTEPFERTLLEPIEEPFEEKPTEKVAFEVVPHQARSKRKPETELPDGFELTEERLEYALSKGWTLERAKDGFEAFAGYHRARGTLFREWNAAWQNWVRNGIRFDRQRGAARPNGGGLGGLFNALKGYADGK